MDLINRNPELNPEAMAYCSEYPDADAVVTGMKPLGLYKLGGDPPYSPAKHNMFDEKNGKAPYKNFPDGKGLSENVLPVKALSFPMANLFGYCGDYIVQRSPLLDRLFTSEP